MPTRAFSIEDGNLGVKTIISSQNRTFSDIDLTFAKKASGDVFKKNSAAAVKQAVKNLLLTNFSEKPFLERFGGDLNALLFRLSTEVDDANLEDKIKRSLELFEPRAKVLNFVFLGIVIVVGLFVAVFVNVKFKSACDDE